MSLGGQTVTLVRISEDLDGPRDEGGQPPQIETATELHGVRFRMESSTETTDPGNRVRETWKLLAPPVVTVLAATSRDYVDHDGTRYSIDGTPKAVLDMSGAVHHVKVACQRFKG